MYIDAGWLDPDVQASHYLPKDFGGGGHRQLNKHLADGVKLGPLQRIQRWSAMEFIQSVESDDDDQEDEQLALSRSVPDKAHRYADRLRKFQPVEASVLPRPPPMHQTKYAQDDEPDVATEMQESRNQARV